VSSFAVRPRPLTPQPPLPQGERGSQKVAKSQSPTICCCLVPPLPSWERGLGGEGAVNLVENRKSQKPSFRACLYFYTQPELKDGNRAGAAVLLKPPWTSASLAPVRLATVLTAKEMSA
jgi:hypothetical protein